MPATNRPQEIRNMKTTKERKMVMSKREISRKNKVDKSRLTGQHKEKLKKGKNRWDTTLNAPTRDGKVGIMASMKLSQMH
jgi:hypothetical protein